MGRPVTGNRRVRWAVVPYEVHVGGGTMASWTHILRRREDGRCGVTYDEVTIMTTKSMRMAVLGLVATGLVVGCGDDDGDDFPVGTYQQTGAGGTLVLREDGTFELDEMGGGLVTEGTYSVDGDQVTWESDSWCAARGEDAESATYEWELDGDQLNLTVVGEDRCDGRVIAIGPGFERSAEE